MTKRVGRIPAWAGVLGAILQAAAARAASATLTPYTAFAWAAPGHSVSHVVGAVWYDQGSNPAVVAAQLKTLPAGQRTLLRWESTQLLLSNTHDQVVGPDHKAYWGPWLADGSAAEAGFEDQFLSALEKQGAAVDYLMLDTEWEISTWAVTQGQLNAILADKRWPALASTFGVKHTNDLINNLNADSRGFGLAMQTTTGLYMHQAFYEPLVSHFPDAHCSDFCDGLLSASLAPQAPDSNDCVQPLSMPLHGDMQAPAYYSDIGNIRNVGVTAARPLTVVNWQVSNVRAYAQGEQPVIPWVPGKTLSGGALAGSPFYDELVFHLLLSTGSTNLNLWDADEQSTQADCEAIDNDLGKVASHTANAPTLTPLTRAAVPYGSAVLASGVRCPDGSRVYRVTLSAISRGNTTVNLILPGETTSTAVTVGNGSCGDWVVH